MRVTRHDQEEGQARDKCMSLVVAMRGCNRIQVQCWAVAGCHRRMQSRPFRSRLGTDAWAVAPARALQMLPENKEVGRRSIAEYSNTYMFSPMHSQMSNTEEDFAFFLVVLTKLSPTAAGASTTQDLDRSLIRLVAETQPHMIFCSTPQTRCLE